MAFIVSVISMICTLYVYLIILRAILSWFSPDPYNPLFRALLSLTEPVLEPMRRIIPPLGGMDLSPIVVILIIEYAIKGFILPFIAGM
jgi:YggT family protein